MDHLTKSRALDTDSSERMTGLSVRETQEAIAKELDADLESPLNIDDPGVDTVDEDDPDAECAVIEQLDDLNADDADDAEDAAAAADEVPDETEDDVEGAVWSAAEAAEHLKMLEALLFAASESLDVASIKKRLPEGADVPALLETLSQQYENRGVRLSHAAGRYQFITNPDVAHVLTVEKTETRRLSKAAMETLAIIAYHQPCTRADIEDIRGVAVSKGSIDQLLEMSWVKLAGRRRDAPGRPVLYATTKDFLEHFDLERISDLPGMADLKAAGLLEANLPAHFQIPSPADPEVEGGDNDDADCGTDGDSPEFVQDFHGPDDFNDDGNGGDSEVKADQEDGELS
ncbi:MAG: SMC-Scp complex subunit ScpB [Pseudomonadota bacterium]